MNTLTHVGEDILKLLDRIDAYNMLFPETALHLVGIQIMSPTNVFPVFSQVFIKNARFATNAEITSYMHSRGFEPMEKDGSLSNGRIVLWDIKPKNVLITGNGATVVIDAEIDIADR